MEAIAKAAANNETLTFSARTVAGFPRIDEEKDRPEKRVRLTSQSSQTRRHPARLEYYRLRLIPLAMHRRTSSSGNGGVTHQAVSSRRHDHARSSNRCTSESQRRKIRRAHGRHHSTSPPSPDKPARRHSKEDGDNDGTRERQSPRDQRTQALSAPIPPAVNGKTARHTPQCCKSRVFRSSRRNRSPSPEQDGMKAYGFSDRGFAPCCNTDQIVRERASA